MKEVLTKILESLGLACWVEIVTENPRCTYYFGPFASNQEAQRSVAGYVEDLKKEGATGISVEIKRVNPKELTIFDELGELSDLERFPALKRQLS
ncbi:DUF1816 domain-containing protein [Lusitaniella coriacea LEGE 07157]|uniref:DUF1816 domain-containing protein n=1 Tax=Lusitaniella coriacea LEGE 07157 TaxID=945747 RepID=A0A8J7DWI7_9CYAN|nr:DUF1816 domain-containing protein [Lusitaniella coriacea]MBE9116348.1 DUF1816 domain-containing protein [Lusitaniella coriacea LEGE 07157]